MKDLTDLSILMGVLNEHWMDRYARCSCGHRYSTPPLGRALRDTNPEEIQQHMAEAIIKEGFTR